MKAIRVSDNLYQSAEKEAAVMHRSTAGQLEFWATIGRKAELLLDPAILQTILQTTVTNDAQDISLRNNQKLSSLISEEKLSAESVRFLDASLVKQSVADFTGSDF